MGPCNQVCLAYARRPPPVPPGPQRILKVEYDWPPHIKLSPECRDLMSRILVAGERCAPAACRLRKPAAHSLVAVALDACHCIVCVSACAV